MQKTPSKRERGKRERGVKKKKKKEDKAKGIRFNGGSLIPCMKLSD